MAQRVLNDHQLAVNRREGAKGGGSGVMVLQGRHGKIIIDEPVIKQPTREDIEGVYRVLVECLLNQHRREQMAQEVKVN
ncbi:MAG: hypothetical protein D9V47_09875 [Clostridia bacterium]|nr:MAG: hypothetical protein D9V47_09875 [Clostridia bacterium]